MLEFIYNFLTISHDRSVLMQKTTLGKTGFNISKIIYGGIVSMQDGQDASDKYVDYAIEKGINYFDVAPSYGDAEEKLGHSLKPYRKNIHLACKTMERFAEPAKYEIEKSLKLLHTDYFDVFQMHSLASVQDVEDAFSSNGVFNVMLNLKEQGVFKNLGITCHSEEAALRALSLYDFDTVLFPTNWSLHLGKDWGKQLSATCKAKNIGFLGMKSMIHRAWLDDAEKATSRFSKSWCKPIFENDALLIAAMKYAFQEIRANVLVPPGNIESFTFAVEHIDQLVQPLTTKELGLLQTELKMIDGRFFF